MANRSSIAKKGRRKEEKQNALNICHWSEGCHWLSSHRFSRRFRFLRKVMGCKGPECSQCRDRPHSQEDSCKPGTIHVMSSLLIFSTDRSVPGGPALGLGAARRGDAGVGGNRGPFSEDTHGPNRAAQTIVDHCAGGRGLRGDSDWTAWQRKYHDDGDYCRE